MPRLGMGEILMVLAIVLLLFGATRLPQLGSSMGKAIRNFKRGFSGMDEEGAAEEKDPSRIAGGNRMAASVEDSSKAASKQS
jgi:sec-independent protein translocase protein TatA